MNRREKIGLGIFVFFVAVFFYLFATQLFLHVSPITLKPYFQVGNCYQLKSSDPFRTHEIRIVIVEIKDGYAKYVYCSNPTSEESMNIDSSQYIWKQISCEKCGGIPLGFFGKEKP